MKLYELAMTPNARRVSIFLTELGLDIERQHVDIRGGENLTPDFKAKSVNGRIPLLELDDGQYLCESVAICHYLDAITPNEQHLFGQTPLEMAQVEMWQRIIENQGLNNAFHAYRNLTKVYSDRENCIEAWGHESKHRAIDVLPTLNNQLATQTYVAGNKFTIADISAYVFIGVMKALKIELDDSMSHIQRWLTLVSQRPAFK